MLNRTFDFANNLTAMSATTEPRSSRNWAICRPGTSVTSSPRRTARNSRPLLRRQQQTPSPSKRAGRTSWRMPPRNPAMRASAPPSATMMHWTTFSAASPPSRASPISPTPPIRQRQAYGDVQAKLTDLGSHLLFFTLELNGSTTPSSKRRSRATRSPPITRPGSATCARKSRISSKTTSNSSSWKSR